MNIGERIRHYRSKKKFTMKKLGEIIDLSEQAIGNYERGDRTPSTEVLIKIANALDVALIDIIGVDKCIGLKSTTEEDQKMIRNVVENIPEGTFMYSKSDLLKKNKEKIVNSISEISKLSDITIKKTYTEGILVDWEITEEGKFPIYDGAGLFGGIEVTYKNKSFTLTEEEYYKLADRIIESIAVNILAAKEY